MLHGDPGIGVLSMRIGMNQIIYAPSYAPAYKVLSMRIGMNRISHGGKFVIESSIYVIGIYLYSVME